MKIEKINDKQIRCTISKADLTERKIKLSELACGTGNSKQLFKDMIRQAAEDFGFEVDDIPLMIEAIPVSAECIILILTKVDNPEETEKHFAQMLGHEGFDMFERAEAIEEAATDTRDEEPVSDVKCDENGLLFGLYKFDRLDTLINVSKMIHPIYLDDSALYKSPDNYYYLSLCSDNEHMNIYKYVTNLLSEYGTGEPAVYNTECFFLEHYKCIIAEDAIEKLSQL